jgi:hypothetical protein
MRRRKAPGRAPEEAFRAPWAAFPPPGRAARWRLAKGPVVACVEASRYLATVCEHAAWAAARLGVGIELLHVEETGRARRLRCAQGSSLVEPPEVLLDAAARLADQGCEPMALCDAQGTLPAVVERVSACGSLVVVGRRGGESLGACAGPVAALVRRSRSPVLVAARLFLPVAQARVVDPPTADPAYCDAVASSPLLDGLDLRWAGTAAGEFGGRRAVLDAREDLVVLPKTAFLRGEGPPGPLQRLGLALLGSPRSVLVC